MAAAIVGDSNLEKMISAELSETVHKMPPPSSSANNKRVPSPFYGEDSSSEDEWEEDAEVEVKIKEEGEVDNSYSLGYSDLSDDEERRVEKTLWYKLMVKDNNIIPRYRPPPPQPTPPPPPPRPRRLRPLMRYAQDLLSSDDEEEFDNLVEWVWPSIIARKYAAKSTTGTSDPDLTI